MADTDSHPLASRAVERLRKLAAGNGLAPAAIQLIEAEEKTYRLTGLLRLEPKTEVEAASYPGGPRGNNRKILPTIGALRAEIARRQKEFRESGSWVAAATKILQEHPGAGWGLDDRVVPLAEFSGIFAASAPCPTCQGSRLLNCPQCNGQGVVICTQCQGRKQEICYNCSGRGVNPAHPDQPCVICHGNRYVPCRFCRASGFLPCPTCNGRRGVACGACNGTGQLTEEATLTCSAITHFSVTGEDLPAGLRRGLDRIGLDKLANGHADIASITPETEKPPDRDPYGYHPEGERQAEKTKPPELHYRATMPYADLRMSFGGKRALVSVFGKKGMLLGVPAFLDEALEPRRKQLKQAAQGMLGLDEALEARAVRDTLTLQLQGKGKVEELRRLYPLGLSSAVAQEMLVNMRLALNAFTRRTRAGVAIAAALLSGAILAGVFVTPGAPAPFYARLTGDWPPLGGLAFELGLPLALGVGSWVALTSSIRRSLQKRFPQQQVPLKQDIGKTGIAMLAAIGLMFIASLYVAPVKPWWVLEMERLAVSLHLPQAQAVPTAPTSRPVLAEPPAPPPLHQQPTAQSANIKLNAKP